MSTLFQAITRPADDFIVASSNLRKTKGGSRTPRKITLEDRTSTDFGAPATSYGSIDGESIAGRQEERGKLQQELAESPNAVVIGEQTNAEQQEPSNIHRNDDEAPAPDTDDSDLDFGLAPAVSNESAPLLTSSPGPSRSKKHRNQSRIGRMLMVVMSSICCCFPVHTGEEDEMEQITSWNASHGISSMMPGRFKAGYSRIPEPTAEEQAKQDKKLETAGNGIFSADPNIKYDILYENQRGFIFFGTPFFSSQSLLNFDPSAWEDANFKYSPVDILTAPVPDPSWEWVWRTWYIDMTYDIDDHGWAYSIGFSSPNWHGAHVWFHSFVRRRRWIRKRKREVVEVTNEAEVAPSRVVGVAERGNAVNGRKKVYPVVEGVTSQYFTVESVRYREFSRKQRAAVAKSLKGHSPSLTGSDAQARLRFNYDDYEDNLSDDDFDFDGHIRKISNIGSLMHCLRKARLDRRKIEAVEQFVKDGGDDIVLLASVMDQIISFLIFQESRRELLRCLLHSYQQLRSRRHNESNDHTHSHPGHVVIDTSRMSRHEIVVKRKALHNAIMYAQKEILKFDYYSDRKVSSKEYARADLLNSELDKSSTGGATADAETVQDYMLSVELARVEEEDLNDDDISDRGSFTTDSDSSTITSRDKGKRPADYRIPIPDNKPNLVTTEQDRAATISTVRNKVLDFVST
ncbi:hypothetical protein V1512DRAFT_259141 [Lipomyces arxii]|uniref:uncharacterized protein n=1 Tax=Lipomyces arxii TaxID=56418 RepID=UPI0034CF1F97